MAHLLLLLFNANGSENCVKIYDYAEKNNILNTDLEIGNCLSHLYSRF